MSLIANHLKQNAACYLTHAKLGAKLGLVKFTKPATLTPPTAECECERCYPSPEPISNEPDTMFDSIGAFINADFARAQRMMSGPIPTDYCLRPEDCP